MDHMELHAVMVPMPMLGHIYPLLHFAKALVARLNFTVTFVNNYFYHHLILADESLSSNSNNGKLRFEWVENGLPSDFDFNNIWPTQTEFWQGCSNMQASLKALMESLNQKHPPVSCVIFGSFFLWGHRAAMELRIPTVFFWSQSAAVFSIYRHMPLLAANGFFPFIEAATDCKEDNARLVSYIPGVSPLYREDFPTFLLVEDRSDENLKTMELQFDLLKDCKAVVINSFYELEKEAFDALQGESLSVFGVGPLLSSSKQGHGSSRHDAEFCSMAQDGDENVERDECLKWLDKQSKHSVLYISFGTLLNPAPDHMKGIAMALRESKQPFLWAFKLKSFYDRASGKFTEISSVGEMLPERFLEDTEGYGILVPWVPQQEVLAHPSVGAFLSHCGWNSTLESVSMGVPMIPLPMASDQTTNSKYVVDVWKVGVRLKLNKSGKVDSADLMRVLHVVFHDEEGQELRKRAGKLKEAARRAFEIGSNDDTNRFCEALMHTIS